MDYDEKEAASELFLQDEQSRHNTPPKIIPQVHVTFDEMLEELGEMGKFQITQYILVCFPVLFAAANSFTYLFVAGQTEFRCQVPVCDNQTLTSYNEEWLPNALPSISKKYYTPAECEMYAPVSNITDLYNGTCSSNLFNQSILMPCDQWINKYDENTIMHEWNIFCKDTWKLPFVGTVHFAGIVFGSAIFGFLADRYGRKIVFIFCIILMTLSGIFQVVCPDYNSFIVLIFINALGTSGVYPVAFIISVELVGKQKRELTAMVLNYFYALGEVIVGIVSWYFHDWILIQLVMSGPPIIFVIYWWLIPESIRWLLATRRTKQARNVIQKVAKTNGVILSNNIMMSLRAEETENETKSVLNKQHNDANHNIWTCVKEMLCSTKMIVRMLIIFYIWTANVFTFYGLSVNSVSMSGNKYLNFTLTSVAAIAGNTLAWILIRNIGRKWSTAGSFLGCSISSVAVIFIPPNLNWLKTCLYLFAKMFVTSSLEIGYIYTAEILPTIVRSGGVGAASTISRFGAMIAPFVPFIYPSITYFPMVLFAGVSSLGGILSLCLPETLGIKLPETAKEAMIL